MATCSNQQIKVESGIIVDDNIVFHENNIKSSNTPNQVLVSETFIEQKCIPTDIPKNIPASIEISNIATCSNQQIKLESGIIVDEKNIKSNNTPNQVLVPETFIEQKCIPTDIPKNIPASIEISNIATCSNQQIKLESGIIVDEKNIKSNNTPNQVLVPETFNEQKCIPTDIPKNIPTSIEMSNIATCSNQQIKLESGIIIDDNTVFNEKDILSNNIPNQVLVPETSIEQKCNPTDIIKKNNADDKSQKIKYKCKKKEKLLSNKQKLNSQLKRQSSVKQSYTCKICQKLFQHKYRYDTHVQSHNVDKEKFECKICNKSFTRKDHINIHNRIHTGEKPYKCETCGKLFSMKHHLLSHNRIHTGQKPYTCDMCNESFTRKDILINHIKTHMEEQLFICIKCRKKFAMKTYTGEKPHLCHLCQPQQTKLELNIHQNQELVSKLSNVETDVKNDTNGDNSEETNQVLNATKEFASDAKCIEPLFCSVQFKEKPYKCHLCQQLFSNKQALDSHVRSHTSKQKHPYTCTICEKSFFFKYRFDAHIINHKMGKYKCNVCDKLFTRKYHFDTHYRTHTGEKPFKCEICQKLFSLKHHLMAHIRTHTGEKPFSCEFCNESFCRKDILSNHIKTHTGEKHFGCIHCQKQFTMKHYLLRHLRTHTGEKPFICQICPKTFSQRSSLSYHLKKHTEEAIKAILM